MGVSENVVYPIVPNGFADHYPYEKWLAIIGNIPNISRQTHILSSSKGPAVACQTAPDSAVASARQPRSGRGAALPIASTARHTRAPKPEVRPGDLGRNTIFMGILMR